MKTNNKNINYFINQFLEKNFIDNSNLINSKNAKEYLNGLSINEKKVILQFINTYEIKKSISRFYYFFNQKFNQKKYDNNIKLYLDYLNEYTKLTNLFKSCYMDKFTFLVKISNEVLVGKNNEDIR